MDSFRASLVLLVMKEWMKLLDEKLCPICVGDNYCKAATEEQSACWCISEKFPEGIFELVPDEKKGRQCICQSCIDTYNKGM